MDKAFVLGVLKDWGIALVLAVLVFVGWRLMSGGPTVGGSAPDFTLKDLDGEMVTLSELQGQVVVVNFWATWCGPCRSEIPELAAFQAEHPDVRLLGVSVDENLSASGVERVAERLGADYRVLLDPFGAASDPYGVSSLPTTVIIDPAGNISATWTGTLTRHDLETLVERAVAE